MGLTYVDVRLSNEWQKLSVDTRALVGTGALFLCIPEAIVMGDEALIGCIPMKAMDVVIDPRSQKMKINPEHPNFAVAHVK